MQYGTKITGGHTCPIGVLCCWKLLKLFHWFGNHFSQTSLKPVVFISSACGSTGARSLSLCCSCHARYTDLLIMLMWVLTGGWKHCCQVMFWAVLLHLDRWPSVAALHSVERVKNNFCFFFLLLQPQQIPLFPLFFFAHYLSKSIFEKLNAAIKPLNLPSGTWSLRRTTPLLFRRDNT